MNKTILVIGAAGFVGTSITKQLILDGFKVRVFVRNAEKAAQMFGSNVEIVTGNFEDLISLDKALIGCDGVNISAPWQAELKIVQNVTSILKKTGKKQVQVSYISGATALTENRWYAMIDQKLKSEEVLIKSGIAYTILRPNWFMDALAFFVNNGRATVFGKQSQSYYFLSLADFARTVSKSHQLESAVKKIFVINGPQALQIIDALQQYCDVVYPGLKVSSMPIWLGKILASMLKSETMKDFVQLMAYFEKSPKISQPEDETNILGKSTETFEEWLKTQKQK